MLHFSKNLTEKFISKKIIVNTRKMTIMEVMILNIFLLQAPVIPKLPAVAVSIFSRVLRVTFSHLSRPIVRARVTFPSPKNMAAIIINKPRCHFYFCCCSRHLIKYLLAHYYRKLFFNRERTVRLLVPISF